MSENKNEEVKNQSLSEELKEFNKEHGVTFDPPLVVHKKGDVSYEENTDAYEMNETHTGEERPTLKRHRFKKEKKSSKKPYIIIGAIVIFAAVFAALYYTGNITFGEKETTTKPTTQATTEDLVAKYKGTIVIKDTYIFVDGLEVDGIEGLQKALKYEDPSPTAYEIIVDDYDSNFYNFEVLPILTDFGFYDETTKVKHHAETGLIAKAEMTTVQDEVVTEPETESTTAVQTEADTTE